MNSQKYPPRQLRDQLLENAARIFAQNGYEGTTVQQVIDSLGVSKGAFYHYFSSKEDLLDAVAESMTQEGLAAFCPILEDRTIPALERLIRYLNQSRQWRMNRMGLIGAMLRMLHRDENAIIRQKINSRAVEALRPLFTQLVADGVAEGVFHTPDPSEAAVLLLQLGNVYVETTVPLMLDAATEVGGVERIERRINFYLDAYERLLGIESGTLPRVDRGRIQLILQLLRSSEGPSVQKEEDH